VIPYWLGAPVFTRAPGKKSPFSSTYFTGINF
jgi:hypothetical protein